MRSVVPTFLLLISAATGCTSATEPAPVDLEPDASVPDAAVDAEVDPPGLPLDQLRCANLAPCDAVDATVTTFMSTTDLESRFVGGWRFCGTATDLWGAGIEVASNHKLYVLEAAPDGSCRRGARGGRWVPLDISEENPPGTYQVTIHYFEGGFKVEIPRFNGSSSGMTFGSNGEQFNRLQPL